MNQDWALKLEAIPTWLMILLMFGNVMWVAVYVLVIRLGFKEKTFGVPMTAICANVAWEFYFSFIDPHPLPYLLNNIAWVAFDFVIVYQLLRFGRSDFIRNVPVKYFLPTFLLTLAFSTATVLGIVKTFGDQGWHAAFAQNMLMSILFVVMLLRRNDITGQSIYIAIFKNLGTLIAFVAFAILFDATPIVYVMGTICLFFDTLYMVMLYNKHLELGVNPWTRA
jgi:hypothetical protein